jgi:hypothetical protein
MADSKAHATPRGPVAVIAVHGVADQGQNETAATAANLLLHLDEIPLRDGEAPGQRGYSGFNERIIRVGVDPVTVDSVPEDDAWHYQVKQHLQDYKGDGSRGAYETIRLEGLRHKRVSENDAPQIDRPVHIYELHWADVSRLKIGALNIFLAIYRLLFETSWLGRQTIGKWASFGKDVGRFSSVTSLRGVMVFFHSVASIILTRVMPLMYVLLIAMLSLTAIPLVESEWAQGMLTGLGGYRGLFATGVVLATAGILIGIATKFWRILPWPPVFGVVSVASFLAWNFAYAWLQPGTGTWWAEAGVAIMAWLAMCACISLVFLPMLNRVFPGTIVLGIVMMGLFTVGLVFGICQETEWPLLFTGPIFAIRMGLALLPFIWIVLATCANLFLITAFLEAVSLWFQRWLPAEVIRRKRARLRTAILSITMPVLLISFLNSTFFQLALIPAKAGGVDGAVPLEGRTSDAPAWVAGVESFVNGGLTKFLDQWASMPNFENWLSINQGQEVRFSHFAIFASENMVIPFLEATFLLVILVLGYSLWTVAPAALAEYTTSHITRENKRWESLSKALGRNLSQGYRWLWAGQLLLAVCLLGNQALFAYRGFRAKELRTKGVAVAEADPMMVLVDRFLGVRVIDAKATAVAAASEGMSEAEGEPSPIPAVAPAVVEPPIVAPDVTPIPSAAAPVVASSPPSAAPVVRPPAARRPSAPAVPMSVPSAGRDRFGRPLAGRRAPTVLSAPAKDVPAPQTVQQQMVKQDRDEIRETIQEILNVGPDISALKEIPSPGVAAAPVPTAAAAKAPPKFVIDAITECVIFFNRGPLTSALGVVILILTIGYLFFARLADPVFAGLRGGLDIALDVVNYLNPNPKERTHRARILARYASLLKYIADWRDPNDPTVGYSRIVILSHSQGSVISSDMFRLLSCGTVAVENGLEVIGGDPKEGGLPVRFYTMGSPLAQLYSSRFPDLYSWDPEADPRVNHRSVEAWWNAYRSGDYVGRMLFRTEKTHKADCFMPGLDFFQTKDGVRSPIRETCVGPGAHTQYWNESAPDVIRGLDRIIATDDVNELAKTDNEAKPV